MADGAPAPKRQIQPIAQYEFKCHGAGVSSSFPDSTGNNLFGSLVLSSSSDDSTSLTNPFQCDEKVGTGIKPKQGQQNLVRPLVSEESSKKLIDHFLQKQQQHQDRSAVQLTTELWFTPAPTEDIVGKGAPIVSINGPIIDPTDSPGVMCGLNNDFQILQRRSENIMLWLFARHVRGCQETPNLYPTNKFTSGALTQVVYQIAHGREKFFVNGIEIVDYEQSAPLNMTAWDPTLHLKLFPDHGPWYSKFTGSVQRLAIYDRSLPSVKNSYQYGLLELEDQKKPRFAPSTIDDGMIPADVDGFPSMLEPVFNSDLKLLQADVVTTDFDLKGKSDVFPSHSNPWWDLKAKIISVPTNGYLSTITNADDDNNNIDDNYNYNYNKALVQVNDTLEVMWDPEEAVFKVPLRYTLEDPTYFNVPQYGNVTTLESFSFRFVAVDTKTGGDLAWSRGMEPKIKVQHVNKQPTFLVSDGTYYKRSTRGDVKAFLKGDIQLDIGEDLLDLNLVRVKIETMDNIKLILLNMTESIHIPKSCQEYSQWQCQKSFNGQLLDFLAYPKEIPNILRERLDFSGPDSGNMTITVFHGEGGKFCPSRNWQLGANETYGNRICYNATAIIPIEKGEKVIVDAEQGRIADPVIVAIISAIVAAIILYFAWHKWRDNMAEGNQYVADEEDIEEARREVERQEQENKVLKEQAARQEQENKILLAKILALENAVAQPGVAQQQQQEPTSSDSSA